MTVRTMCGIIAYSGRDNAIPYLVEGIKELEYRGYDSFGCAIDSGNELIIEKGIGIVSRIIDGNGISKFNCNRGIFHTRWATHGKISRRNAHPQVDCTGKIAVIHNGIIENWKEIRKALSSHTFKSSTDTEVIPHLVEELLSKGKSLKECVTQIGKKLIGSSSFVVMQQGNSDFVAYKGGSPLILALGKEGNFVSSDVPSILKYTNRIVYLRDGDVVSFSDTDFKIENIHNPAVTHVVTEVSLNIRPVNKGEYEFYMEKEIFEQPELWKAMEKFPKDKLFEAARNFKKGKRVYLIASGTSHYASLYGSMLLRKTGVDALAIQPQEFEFYKSVVSQDDLFIVISQSGETADIISILPLIERNFKIGIVNVEGSYLASKVDMLLEMTAGIEKGVAATKTLTNTLIILSMLASTVSGNYEGGLSGLTLLNKKVYDFLVPSVIESIAHIADLISEENDVYFVGKGYGYVLSQEGALKMKEISYLHAESIDLATIKHGPLALISEGTKVIAIVTNGSLKDSSYNLEELKSRGAFVIGVSETRSYLFDKFIRLPSVKNYSFAPILLALQMLALRVAVKKGLDPDKPRNLAKSVTVR